MKRKSSRDLQSSNPKDIRTDSTSPENGTFSSRDDSASTNGGSPLLSSSFPPAQRQRRITDYITQSTPPGTQTSPLVIQSTPLRSHDDSVFQITGTHNALLNVVTDIFSTPSAGPSQEFVTIKATDLESLLSATNNMQKHLVKLTSQVTCQQEQMAVVLQNQDKITRELSSLKTVLKPVASENIAKSTTPGITVQTRKAKPAQDKNKKEQTHTGKPTPKTANTNNKQTTRGKQVPPKTNKNNNLDEHIDKHLPMWRKNHFYRRSEYKRYYHHLEKTKIIEDHISKKYIPGRYRPKQTHTKLEYTLEEKHSYATMRHEFEKLTFHADNARKNFESTDQEMFERIDLVYQISDDDKDNLKELWLIEVTKAVEKAHELCEYNLSYLRSLPQKEPYLGYQGIPTDTRNTRDRNTQYNHHNNNHHNKRGFR